MVYNQAMADATQLKKLQEIESKFTAEVEKYKQEYNLAIKKILADIEKRKLDSVRSALKI